MSLAPLETAEPAATTMTRMIEIETRSGGVRSLPATRTSALELLEHEGTEAPHVWYDLLGVAADMRGLHDDPMYDGEPVPVADVLEHAEWWRKDPLDALIPALPDRNGDYWVEIQEPGGVALVDTFPLFKGVMDTAEGGRVPDYILQAVLEARGYADVAEVSVTPPPTALHAGETQQYSPVNIVREQAPEGDGSWAL